MASIRKRRDKWQVQVRRQGQRPLTRTFNLRKDAEAWARKTEVQADRHELPQSKHDPKLLDGVTLGDLVKRYIDEVCSKKRSYAVEQVVLEAFPIVRTVIDEHVSWGSDSYTGTQGRTAEDRTTKISAIEKRIGWSWGITSSC